MKNAVILDEREQEYVVRAIETSLDVSRKHQLFLWTQGMFHGLVPHDILICLQFDETGRTLHLECLTSAMVEGDIYKRLCDPHTGFAVRLARHCQSAELRLPWLMSALEASNMVDKRLLAELRNVGLHSALVHGRQSTRGGGWDYFILLCQESQVGNTVGARHAYFMELLLPHLHSAFHRVMLFGKEEISIDSGEVHGARLLTDRETEIMHWVREGKSNQEIGAILNISQLTVKNHVQNILKKLKVQNRAQAVSEAISMRLLSRSQ